jgi:hypothetical protein
MSVKDWVAWSVIPTSTAIPYNILSRSRSHTHTQWYLHYSQSREKIKYDHEPRKIRKLESTVLTRTNNNLSYNTHTTVTCRLKAAISESERAFIASQRLDNYVSSTAGRNECTVVWVTTVNAFTWQRVHRQTVTMEMKNRNLQGGVCYLSRLVGIKGGQLSSQKREVRHRS